MIKSDPEFTHIVGGHYTQEQLNARIEEIRDTIANEPSKHLQGVHKERMARLTSTIAEI